MYAANRPVGRNTRADGMVMHKLAVNGVNLAYEERGDGEPVMLVHLAVFADGFAPLMDQPALSRYRLIRYHRRGYGISSHSVGPITVRDQAADLKGLLEYLGVGRVHVVGHSFGGLVALEFAATYPDRVGSLVLMEAALRVRAGGPSSQEMTRRMVQGFQRYRAGDREGGLIDAMAAVIQDFRREEVDRLLPGAWTQAVRDVDSFFGNDFLGVQGWEFGEHEATRITAPVLWVASDKRHAAFMEMEQLLSDWFPQLETACVPGVNHLLQMQQPRPVAERLADFFVQRPLA